VYGVFVFPVLETLLLLESRLDHLERSHDEERLQHARTKPCPIKQETSATATFAVCAVCVPCVCRVCAVCVPCVPHLIQNCST
jgi:hypothetical protein